MQNDARNPMVKHEEHNRLSISRSLLLTLIAAGFALGIFVGAGMNLFTPQPATREDGRSEYSEGAFNFIRPPAVPKDDRDSSPGKELNPFRYKVNEAIERIIQDGDADGVSVYFRDLITGSRFGIGDREKVLPVNLLKLQLMIAYFKWSETSPVVLRKTLTYSGTERQPTQRNGNTSVTLEAGKIYTVNELIFRMIAYNDDAAFAVLSINIPRPRLEKIFKELYVEYDPQQQDEYLSLSAYGSFYRVLFNASYLTEEMSEKALRFLSRSASRTALSAGIPHEITLSGNSGEQVFSKPDDDEASPQLQVHEFGIIYHAHRPFLLGIAVRGSDADQLRKTIRDLTRLIYEEVDQQS